MKTADLINRIAISNNISIGRAEMIITIIFEKISDELKKNTGVSIDNFGKFILTEKHEPTGVFKDSKKAVEFIADQNFILRIN